MRSGMRIVAGLAGVLLATAAAAQTPELRPEVCGEAAERFRETHGAPLESQPTPTVLMYKSTFCPQHLTVPQGTAVRFLNVDRRTSHSFWFRDAGQPESERFFPGEGATVVLDMAPGEHTYLCGPHWEHQGMVGRITITPR